MEEVNERAFLLGGEGGANAHCLAGGVVGVNEDLLDVLHWFEGSGRLLCVGRSFGDVLAYGRELNRGEGRRGELAALNLTLVGFLEGSTNGDDPARAWHLKLKIGVVRDGHELRVTWSPQHSVVDRRESDYLKGKGLCPIVG